MPGANYMGGKRNAMKARAKDTIGRQEKGHFGRQRLNMLSQGLSTTKPSERPHKLGDIPSSSKTRPDIDLAHARQKLPVENDTSWFMPKAIHISPSTPRSRKYMRGPDAHTSSSRSDGRSEVLDALDTPQPLFLRRIIDEILSMPDLAGLSGIGQAPVSTEAWPRDEFNHDSNHVAPIEDRFDHCKMFNPRSKIEIEDMLSRRKRTPLRSSRLYRPPSGLKGLFSDNGPSFESKLLQSNIRHRNRSFRASVSNIPFEREDSSNEIHDNGFVEFIHDQQGTSSPWSTEQRQRSSKENEDVESIRSDRESSHSPDSSLLVDPYCDDDLKIQSSGNLQENDVPGNVGTVCGGLPSSIRLGPAGLQHGVDRERSVYGSLFEQSDPWNIVGLILGLSESQAEEQIIDQLLTEEGAFILDENDWKSDSLFGEPCQDEEYMSDDHAPKNVTWENIVPDYGSTPIISSDSIHRSPLTMDCNDDRSMGRTEISPRHESIIEILLAAEGQTEDECSPLDPPYDTIVVDQSSTLARSDKAADLEPMDDVDGDQISKQVTDTGLGILGGETDGEKINIEVPELREVNGRFLGPSLFDDFDESD